MAKISTLSTSGTTKSNNEMPRIYVIQNILNYSKSLNVKKTQTVGAVVLNGN